MAEAARGRAAAGHPVLRRPGGWLLLGGVTLLHLLAADELVSDRFGWGSSERPVPRIEVAFVRELQQAAPPEAAPPAAARPRARALPAVAERAAPPASAAEAVAEAPPEPPPPPPVSEPVLPPPVADAPLAMTLPGTEVQVLPLPPAEASEPAATQAASAPTARDAAPSIENFAWPPSTRLTYVVDSYYRGEVPRGQAQVEWLRSGSRYQVHLEVSAGPLTRRASSEGELTERGLEPRRFEGSQRFLFNNRRWTQQFEPGGIVLGDGKVLDTQPGVQDEASQFVQLTWLFTTQPALLQVGRSVEMPLIINRRLDRWIYDIKEQQTLELPFGTVPTYYVKPRREARPGTMVAEIWIAPTLQYLPVRILIRQAEGAYADMTLERPPLQASAEPTPR